MFLVSKSFALLVCFVWFLSPVLLSAQTRSYIATDIQSAEPTIDGLLTDEAWLSVGWDSAFVQRGPYDGSQPTQRTAFALAYDKSFIYFAVRAYDSDPSLIASRVGRRDDINSGDMVVVMFDSFRDRRTAFAFAVTAAGVRIDAVCPNDRDDCDYSWNPVWHAVSSVDFTGWTVEARIPLDQLRFGDIDEQVWGFQVGRHLYRIQEWSFWQPMAREAPGWASQFGELGGLRLGERGRSVEILPHLLARTHRSEPQSGNPFRTGHREDAAGGLDLKIRSSSSITLDLTVNPDFGQVEVDPSVVNLTAFETRFEERRPFFIEGAEILAFDLPGSSAMENTDLFYSRRIGRPPRLEPILNEGEYARQSESTTILGAAKLTGRTESGLSIGVVNAFTAVERSRIAQSDGQYREDAAEPLANYMVTRIMRDIDDGNFVVGGVFTATNRRLTTERQLATLNSAAYTGGFNLSRRWRNRTYFLEFSTAVSHIRGDSRAITRAQLSSARYYSRPDAEHLTFDPTRSSLTGHGGSLRFGKAGNSRFLYNFRFNWRSPGFELNDLGFLRHADLMQAKIWLGYFINNPVGILRQASLAYEQLVRWDFGGRRTFLEGYLQLQAQFMNAWGFWSRMYLRDAATSTRALRGGPAMRFEGSKEVRYRIYTDESRPLTFGVGGASEWSNDGISSGHGVGIEVAWQPDDAVALSLSPEYARTLDNLHWVVGVETIDGERYVMARLRQSEVRFVLRVNLALAPNFTIQYFGQPFFSAGQYDQFKRIVDPLNVRYANRFEIIPSNELSEIEGENRYNVSESTSGNASYSFHRPDFNVREFRSNLVLRWEYLPGSTLFLVWSQDRSSFSSTGRLSLSDDWSELFHDPSENIFLVKLSYWLSI